jgi:hypothetical protein
MTEDRKEKLEVRHATASAFIGRHYYLTSIGC